MRIALGVVFLLHGFFHLLGVVSCFGLVELPQLSGTTLVELGPTGQHLLGGAWLVGAILMLCAGVQLLQRRHGWWATAVVALAVSQLLIVFVWHDAKAGTLVNAALVLGVVIGWGPSRFSRETAREVRILSAGLSAELAERVRPEELDALPKPVARWLARAGVVGRPRVRTVVLRQRGQLRAAIDQPFADATAEQYINVETPGFVWSVETSMKHAPVLGRDAYLRGRGRMLISIGGLSSVIDATGAAIDHDTLLRFLAELVWCPSGALSPYVQWRALDDRSAEATMSYRGVAASAVFSFDEHGRVATITSRRYLGNGTAAKLETWTVQMTRWQTRHGVEVPTRGAVAWVLGGERFETYRWEITKLEYDVIPRSAAADVQRNLWPAWTAVALTGSRGWH